MKDLTNYIEQHNIQSINEATIAQMITGLFGIIAQGFKAIFDQFKDKWDDDEIPAKEDAQETKETEDELNDSTRAAVDNALDKMCGGDESDSKSIKGILKEIRNGVSLEKTFTDDAQKKVRAYMVFVKLAKLSQDAYESSSQILTEIKSLMTDMDIKSSKSNLEDGDFAGKHEGSDPILQTITEYVLKMSLSLGPKDEFMKKLYIPDFMSGVQLLICTQMTLGFSDGNGAKTKDEIPEMLETVQYILSDIFGFKNIQLKS